MTPELVSELAKYDALKLECDGMSRVLSYVLRNREIAHGFVVGHLEVDGKVVIRPHFWLRTPDDETIDFRARMWAGNLDYVPHGVFQQKDYPRVGYVASKALWPAPEVPKIVFEVLTGPFHGGPLTGEAARA